MSRIRNAFNAAQEEDRAALICYLMAGSPSLEGSKDMVKACVRGGADIIELGMPYSDPVADGKVIQEAAMSSLGQGTMPRDTIRMVKELRGELETPMVLMGYYNPIQRLGEELFVSECTDAGVDGLIVPDLPMHESTALRSHCRRAGLDLIHITTTLTSPARREELVRAGSGFTYMMTRTGVTGPGLPFAQDIAPLIASTKRIDPGLPLALGFGVSGADDVRRLRAAGADGVIVGSLLVGMVSEGSSAVSLEREVVRLSEACGNAMP